MQKAKTLVLAVIAALGLSAGTAMARDTTDPVFAVLQSQGAQATASYYLAVPNHQFQPGSSNMDTADNPRVPLQIFFGADDNGG